MWATAAASTHLSASSTCCKLKSSEGTILSMCCGSQMLAWSSSFTVFLTTPCRPLMPDIRILGNKLTAKCYLSLCITLHTYISVGETVKEVEEKAQISALLEVITQMTPQDLACYAPKQSFHFACQRDSASHKMTDTSRKGSEPA